MFLSKTVFLNSPSFWRRESGGKYFYKTNTHMASYLFSINPYFHMLVSYEVEGACTSSQIKHIILSPFVAGCHTVPRPWTLQFKILCENSCQVSCGSLVTLSFSPFNQSFCHCVDTIFVKGLSSLRVHKSFVLTQLQMAIFGGTDVTNDFI